MQVAIVALLILCNGLLSMSEFAVVSSQRSRLATLADEGKRGAQAAIELVDESSRFLSTVQIGITLVGILAGAFGGAAIADDLARIIGEWSFIGPRAQSISLAIVVGLTTYFTLVIGELVPKQVAIRNPERVASVISGPMKILSTITFPLVAFLSASSTLVLRVIGQGAEPEDTVSEEEVKLLLRRGEQTGVFRRAERQMVAGVFRLDDIRADAVMTPRVDVAWLPADATGDEIRHVLDRSPHSHYPVCDGQVDRVLGIVSARSIAAALLAGEALSLRNLVTPVEFVPESSNAGLLVQRVAETGHHFLVVVSEHGGVDGIVTTTDLSEAVLGDLGEPEAQRLGDRRYRVSGAMPIEEVEAVLDTEGMVAESAKSYGTMAGFVMNRLGRVPVRGEQFEWSGFRFTVEEVKRHRVRWVEVEAVEEED